MRAARISRKSLCSLGGVLVLLCLLVAPAWAIPALQLYIEGSTYDPSTETWVLTPTGPFTLWVIGNVEKFGSLDVYLTAAVSSVEIPGGSLGLTPTTTTLLSDPSTPTSPTPTANFPSSDGAVPSYIPPHGIYRAGTSFFEWDLGLFSLTDSPIGDFIDSFPTSFPRTGQINAYTVAVSGFSQVHFDAYGYYGTGNSGFVPPTHDAAVVPEPATLVLLGSGLSGIAAWGWRRRNRAEGYRGE